MSWLVQPRPVNGPFDDPGLYLDVRYGRRALLFDLGDLHALSAREVMRVSDAFVSHAHMDHFAGFDRLLRICLHRPERLRLVGPAGFIERVEHRLESYTWNLLGADSVDFRLLVSEFEAGRLAGAAEFRARDAFARRDAPVPDLPDGQVLAEEQFRVEAVALDHAVPSLAFALREPLRVNVWRGSLERLGLPVGPWLNAAKRAVRTGAADDTPIAVSETITVPLGALKAEAFRVGPGQVVAYVTDAVFSAPNIVRIVALLRNADQAFVEAVFLDADVDIAAARRHLTAAQAGWLARQAGARHFTPFHFSPRYLDRPDALADEAARAFAGEIEPSLIPSGG